MNETKEEKREKQMNKTRDKQINEKRTNAIQTITNAVHTITNAIQHNNSADLVDGVGEEKRGGDARVAQQQAQSGGVGHLALGQIQSKLLSRLLARRTMHNVVVPHLPALCHPAQTEARRR
jgi:hypothetical protein